MSDSIREKVDDLNARILEGDILGAFEEYYAEDVVMEEGDDRREGKEANREYEEQFVNAIQEFRAAEVKAVAVNEEDGVAFVEWYMDFTLDGVGDVEQKQTAVQYWKDGQIVHEKFYKIG
jgi:ketosteroid isomerase-like protein